MNFKILQYIFVIAISVLCEATKIENPCLREKHRNSFLWKLKREPPVYFFGTIHVPYTRVWDYIPTNTRRAFDESDNVYFELDLTDVTTGMALSRCKRLPVGSEIKQLLPPDLYLRLKRHLNYVRRAMPSWVTSEQMKKGLTASLMYNEIAGGWERKRPIWIMLMINALTKPDIRSRGLPVLDVHLARQAGVMRKHVGAIETVEEQCEPFNGLNISQALFALNHTLLVQERIRRGSLKIPYSSDDLVNKYNCGDLSSLLFGKDTSQLPTLRSSDQNSDDDVSNDVTNDDIIMDNAMASEIDDYLKEELIFRRNERMATRVKDLIRRRKDESLFFAFGAGHFLGNGSVIDYLTKEGYEIERVEADFGPRAHKVVDVTSLPMTWKRGNPIRKHKRQGGRKTRQNRKSGERRRSKSRGLRRRTKKKKNRSRNDDVFSEVKNIQNLWVNQAEERFDDDSYFRYYPGAFLDSVDSRSHIRIVNRLPTPAYDVTERNNLDSIFKFNWTPFDGSEENYLSTRQRYRPYTGYDVMNIRSDNWSDDANSGRRSTTQNNALVMTSLSVLLVSIIVSFLTDVMWMDYDVTTANKHKSFPPELSGRICDNRILQSGSKQTISPVADVNF